MMSIDHILAELNLRYGADRSVRFEAIEGDRYFKIVERTGDQAYQARSVYAFIAIDDSNTKTMGPVKSGDILKPASWNAPAKHARGNIDTLNAENFELVFGKYGVMYLR